MFLLQFMYKYCVLYILAGCEILVEFNNNKKNFPHTVVLKVWINFANRIQNNPGHISMEHGTVAALCHKELYSQWAIK